MIYDNNVSSITKSPKHLFKGIGIFELRPNFDETEMKKINPYLDKLRTPSIFPL